MGTVSRVHTFSSGAILTAAQLNNEFDNLLTSSAINGGLDATNLGVTAGQATASKALVVDGSRNLADGTAGNRINNLALSGTLESTGLITATAGITSGSNIVSDTDSTDDLGTTGVRWRNLYVDGVTVTDNVSTGGTLGVTGLLTATGGITSGSNIVSDTDSTDDLGTTSVRWANLFVDSIGDTSQTLSIASLALSFNAASEINTSGNNALTITTGSANLNVTAGTLALTGAQTISSTLGVSDNVAILKTGGADTELSIYNGSSSASAKASLKVGFDSSNHLHIHRVGNDASIVYNSTQSGSDHQFQVAGSMLATFDADGLKFGTSTAAANALDSYEEGTWAPAANEGSAFTVHSARYTKIGNIVKATAFIEGISPTDNSNRFRINGLPFTTSSAAAYYNVGVIGFSGSAKTEDMGLLAQRNETYLYFHFLNSTNSGGFVQNTDVVSRSISTMIFSITYTAQ